LLLQHPELKKLRLQEVRRRREDVKKLYGRNNDQNTFLRR
jgi:hypothetical protein